MKYRFQALLLALCLLLPAQAFGQDDDKVERAQEAFDQGINFYVQQEYGKAIAEFRKGHQVLPSGMFLYNISLSYIKLKNWPAAIKYAREAAARGDLPKKHAAKNHARHTAVSMRIQAGALAKAAAEKTKQDQGDLFGGGQQGGGTSQPAPSRWPGLWTYVGAGSAVVGAGLVAGAVVIGSDVQTRIDTLGGVEDKDEYDRMRSSIESDRTVGQVLLFSGIGLVAAGSGLAVWDYTQSEQQAQFVLGAGAMGAPGASFRLQW